jgi:hypothetical protein
VPEIPIDENSNSGRPEREIGSPWQVSGMSLPYKAKFGEGGSHAALGPRVFTPDPGHDPAPGLRRHDVAAVAARLLHRFRPAALCERYLSTVSAHSGLNAIGWPRSLVQLVILSAHEILIR